MLKFIGLSATLFTNILVVLSSAQLEAIALDPDYPCYMIAPSGQTVDLSNSLCRSQHTIVDAAANIDDLFLADYKQALIKKYPNLNNVLLQPPEANVGYAHAVCNGLKSGLSPDVIQSLQNEQIVNTISGRRTIVDLELINLLAPKYYCPQFK